MRKIWEIFKSLDKFTKLLLLSFLILSVYSIATTNVLFDTRTRAQDTINELTGVLDQTSPKVKEDYGREGAYIDKMKTSKKSLSKNELSVRQSLINRSQNGVVYIGKNVDIQYDQYADRFDAGIMSQNTDLAKAEAENWLRSQGLTRTGICNLPLNYVLYPEVQDNFPGNQVFSTIPLACGQ